MVRIMFLTAQVPALNGRADFSQDVNVEQDARYIKVLTVNKCDIT